MFITIGANWKLIAAIIAGILVVFGGHIPYLRDMFRNKTKPHAYTWLIWSITYGTATVAMWHGQGGWGFLGMAASCFFIFLTFILSLKYGTRNITKGDTVILILALSAIVVWWQLNNPMLAVLMVSAIDVVGYLPSYRKVYHEPWSETVASWIFFTLANFFSIAAASEYNFLTLTYLLAISTANITLLIICLYRRRIVPESA